MTERIDSNAGSTTPLVLVTGSSRGIGRGIATHLAASGSRVVLHGRDPARLDRTRAELADSAPAGTVLGGVAADLTRPEDVTALRTAVETEFGVPDGLVLNAGGSTVPPGPLEDLDVGDWEQALAGNLTSAFLTLKAFLPAMKQRGSGSIVAVSSSVTRRAGVRSPVGYTAAKAGLEALIRCVAVQAGPAGIQANCVVPETIMTERNEQMIPAAIRAELIASHPLRRLGTVEDVAAVVGFLLSPAAAWTTGESVGVTGGV